MRLLQSDLAVFQILLEFKKSRDYKALLYQLGELGLTQSSTEAPKLQTHPKQN